MAAQRILQVVEPGIDGVFRHVEGLCYDLLRRRVLAGLAYSSRRGSDRLNHLVNAVQAAGGETLDLRVGNAPEPGDLRALLRLRRLASRLRPDVIHAHSSKAGALARGLRFLGSRVPVVYTPNAYYGLGSRQGAKAAVFNGVERLCGPLGTTINVSNDEADFARTVLGIHPRRQRVIFNGVDTEAFAPAINASRLAWRAAQGLPADAIVIGTAGRMSFQKDPETLYRALEPLMRHEPRLHLFHLGRGELRRQLDELASQLQLRSRVRCQEYLADTREFYGVLDGFVLTSRYEGLSFAVLEALSCGLPLILSDVPGNREFLRLSLSHCWSAQSGDVSGFSRSLQAWLEDIPAVRSNNHRQTALEHFSLGACHEKILNLYAAVVAG
jgi:glycosyltransferase involved in cell wall biosynthesis